METLAALAPLPVTARVEPSRHPGAVEATAYFVIAEALANVARHARASRADVTARLAGCQLFLEITDDGIGGVERNVATVFDKLGLPPDSDDNRRVLAVIAYLWASA